MAAGDQIYVATFLLRGDRTRTKVELRVLGNGALEAAKAAIAALAAEPKLNGFYLSAVVEML